jgi:hypothetical protein
VSEACTRRIRVDRCRPGLPVAVVGDSAHTMIGQTSVQGPWTTRWTTRSHEFWSSGRRELVPGEDVSPGQILLMCGAVVAVLGVALIVLVLRMLLAQAVARDGEAARMQAELDEII